MERTFPGANQSYGHVGLVETLNNGRMTMRGANQSVGTNYVTENDCNNVRLTGFGANVNGNSRISFWKCGSNQTNNQAIPRVALLVSKATGRALDGGAANSGGVYLNASVVSSNDYEQWRIQPVSRNEYMLINVRSGRALDAGEANGTQVYPNPNVDTNKAVAGIVWQLRSPENTQAEAQRLFLKAQTENLTQESTLILTEKLADAIEQRKTDRIKLLAILLAKRLGYSDYQQLLQQLDRP